MNVIHCHIPETTAFKIRPFFGEWSTFLVLTIDLYKIENWEHTSLMIPDSAEENQRGGSKTATHAAAHSKNYPKDIIWPVIIVFSPLPNTWKRVHCGECQDIIVGIESQSKFQYAVARRLAIKAVLQ